MYKYPKIFSIFKRNEQGKFIINNFSRPELEYLKDVNWIGTEKIDGMNIRIIYNPLKLSLTYHGRTEDAIIPDPLFDKLRIKIPYINIEKVFSVIESKTVVLYGEGYGRGIQKRGVLYNPDEVDFILFDVNIGGIWLNINDVHDIANKLGIKSVPPVYKGNLQGAITLVSAGFRSSIGLAMAEGVVLIPEVELMTKTGKRIITKIKTKDF